MSNFANINISVVGGRVVQSPRLFESDGKMPFLKFSIANSERRASGDHTNFLDCVVFGEYARSLSKWLESGMRVVVEGALHQSEWTDRDSQKSRRSVGIVVGRLEFFSNENESALLEDALSEEI